MSHSTPVVQYAVPVTIESLAKGFVAHTFWGPRRWGPRLQTFRYALYTIENPHSPIGRKLVRRLPQEIIEMIVQDVKETAVGKGFHDCEQRMGVLKSTANQEIEKGLIKLEKQGRMNETFIADPGEDVVAKFLMDNFALSIMPGMSYNGKDMTHLFLCSIQNPSLSPSVEPFIFQDNHCNLMEHLHPALSKERAKSAPTTTCNVFSHFGGYWRGTYSTRICVFDREFVLEALDSREAIGRAVRELRLEVVSLYGDKR